MIIINANISGMKKIRELVDDLSGKFLEDYQISHPLSKVADYPHYFLGSIIISKKDSVGLQDHFVFFYVESYAHFTG